MLTIHPKTIISKIKISLKAQNPIISFWTTATAPARCGGARARSKGSGSGPDGVGLRGFKSHPPHHNSASFIESFSWKQAFSISIIEKRKHQ